MKDHYPPEPANPFEVVDGSEHVLHRCRTWEGARVAHESDPEARSVRLSDDAIAYVSARVGLPALRSSVEGRVCIRGGPPLTWTDACLLVERVTPSRPMPPHET